jgi:glycosyltransferase involved in cell wall biosynthesis
MTRVLFLAYFFPPIGGAGAQRNTKVARHLPRLGYELTVVTGPGRSRYEWTPPDDTLVTEIDSDVEVIRLPAPEPPRSDGWRGRAERWLGLRSPWLTWWDDHAFVAALEHGQDADVVYASLAPFGTARTAVRIARELGKPLIVDLEDPWALDEMLIYPSALHRRLAVRAMRRALEDADAVVMNTPEAAARVLETFPELRTKPVVAIVNGFDAADFAVPTAARTDGVFRIVHTGSLHTDLGARHRRLARVRGILGGAVPGVDLLTRSHVYLLEAVDRVLCARPELADRIELHLAGRLTPADEAAIGDRQFVRRHGFVCHGETIALMRSANLLFLPMHDVPPGRRVAIVPCKTYEYLASGRPILAAVPDGDARDLLAAAGNALLCRPNDVDAMERHLRSALEGFDTGRPVASPNEDVLARVERRQLTKRLADLIDDVAGRARMPGRRTIARSR